jgi:cytochrome c-type biogenesis protein
LGRFFAIHQQTIQIISGLLIIFFGFYIVGLFKLPFFMRSKEVISLKNRPAGYLGSALIGISFGSTWTPCIGPILGAILALAGASQGIGQGVVLLMTYSIGLAIPFILTSLAVGHFMSFFQKFKKTFHVIYLSGGIFLVLIGILVISGYFTILNSFFTKLIPQWLLERI